MVQPGAGADSDRSQDSGSRPQLAVRLERAWRTPDGTRPILLLKAPEQAFAPETLWPVPRARFCSAPRTWPPRAHQGRNPGSRRGALRTDPSAQDRARPEDTVLWLSAGAPHRDPWSVSLITVVTCGGKAFQAFPAVTTPGGRPAMFFKYNDLKDCFAR